MVTPGKDGKIRKFDAIYSLVGGNISGASDGSKVTYHDGQTPPTEEQIQAKLKELEDEYEKQSYARARLQEYPDLQECIHAILDNDLTALQAKRKLVKDKFPKPT